MTNKANNADHLLTSAPAFPVNANWDGSRYQTGESTVQFPGITKRDYFAAKALVGILASPHLDTDDLEAMARSAVAVADAVIAQLDEA